MNGEPDLMTMMNEAAIEAKDDYVTLVRDMKANTVNRPLIGKKLTSKEATAQYRAFREDPFAIGSEYDRVAAQYQLPKDKPIPRRVIDHLLRGEKWIEAADKEEGE